MQIINRRSFIRLGAQGVIAGSMVPTLLGAQAQQGSKQQPANGRKAIMWGTIGVKGTTLEKMQAVKAAGFDGVEMSSHMDKREVLKACEETGLLVPSVCNSEHWRKPLSDPDPSVRKAGVDALKVALEDAKAYGAASVLMVPGVVNAKVSYDECWKRSIECLREALPTAERLGVKIAIENVWNQFLLSPLEAARYVDQFNNPMVGWHFDVGNVILFGWPEQWIRILGKRILKVHFKEFSRSKCDKEGRWKGFDVRLGEGDNDWPAIVSALKNIGYTDWFITEQGGGSDPEGLKALAAGVDAIVGSGNQ